MPKKEPKQEANQEPKYAPLTEQEKKTVLDRHKYLVDRMNQTLPDEMKLSYDKDLEKKLDDPNFYGIYRIGQQMKEQKARQAAIQANLESRFGRSNHDPDPLSRIIKFEFDTSGTPSADEYNEKLYQAYLEDPYKVVKMRYDKAIKTDPTAIYNCNDDPLKLAEYYRDTYPLCEEAFVFQPVMETGNKLSSEMLSAKASLVKPMETISYPTNMIKAAGSLEYLACPKLTADQSALIQGTNLDLVREGGDDLKRCLDEPLVQATTESPKTFFGKFVEHGIPLKEGMFVSNRPVTFELDEQGNRINEREVKYDEVFGAAPGAHAEITQRSGQSLFGVNCMNKSFQAKYQEAFQAKFNQKRGYNGPFDLNQIEKRYQGNFVERNILRSTSPEYKQFLEAFKQYNDPESPNYLNKENLTVKGNAYIQHKVDQGYSIETLKGTSKDRVDFVMNAITTANELDSKDIEDKLFEEFTSIPRREPFLSEEAVSEENVVEQAQDAMSLENSMEVDDLNVTI